MSKIILIGMIVSFYMALPSVSSFPLSILYAMVNLLAPGFHCYHCMSKMMQSIILLFCLQVAFAVNYTPRFAKNTQISTVPSKATKLTVISYSTISLCMLVTIRIYAITVLSRPNQVNTPT
jgi:hypothetical protein